MATIQQLIAEVQQFFSLVDTGSATAQTALTSLQKVLNNLGSGKFTVGANTINKDLQTIIANANATEAEIVQLIYAFEKLTKTSVGTRIGGGQGYSATQLNQLQEMARAAQRGYLGKEGRQDVVDRLKGQQQIPDTPRKYVEANFGPDVQKHLQAFLRQYNLTFDNIRNVNRELSTGITRLDLSSTLGANKRGFDSLSLTVDRHGQIITDTQKRYRTFGDAILRDIKEVAKWSIAIAVIYGPMQKLNELIDEMITNQSKLADVQIATNQTSEQVATTFKTITQVASETGETVAGTIDAYRLAYQAAGSIVDPSERAATATSLLKDSLVLSKLSGLDQAQALDILSGGLKQLDMDLTQSTVLLDKWVAVSKVANVNIDTLATSFVTTATSARNVGLDIDKLNGVIAAVAEVSNKSATETANMVRAFISGFQTDQAKDALNSFGIAITDSDNNARDFLVVMEELKALMDSGIISQAQAAKLAETLGGGARRGAQYAAFFENFGRVQQIAEVSASAAGDAYDALGVKLDTVETASTKLANAFSVLAQTLGTEGGMLDNIQVTLKALTGLVDLLNKLTSALGRATPLLAAFGVAALYMGRNPGAKAGFLDQISKTVYNIGYGLGNLGQSKFGLGTPQGSSPFAAGHVASAEFEKYRQAQTTKLYEAQQAASAGLPQMEQEAMTMAAFLNNSQKAGDNLGKRFVNAVSKNAGVMFAGIEIVLATAMHAAAGEWGDAAAGALGGALGGIFSGFNPIFMILGQALGEGFYNTFIDYKTDMGASLATSYVDALKLHKEPLPGETPEAASLRQTQEAAEARTKQLTESTTGTGLQKTDVMIGLWLQNALNAFTKDTEQNKNLFENFIYDYVNGIIPEGPELQRRAEEALKDQNLDVESRAILTNISTYYRNVDNKLMAEPLKKSIEQRFRDTLEYLTDFAAQRQAQPGYTGKVTTPAVERQQAITEQLSGAGINLQAIMETRQAELIKQFQYGKLSLREYKEQIDLLGGYEAKLANIFAATFISDTGISKLDEMNDSINGTAETFEYLSEIITGATPEEISQIEKLSTTANDLYNIINSGTLTVDEKKTKDQEYLVVVNALINALNLLRQAENVRTFEEPQIFELPEGATQGQVEYIRQQALALQEEYFKVFVPDPAVQAYLIEQWGLIGFLSGKAYLEGFEGIGPEFIQSAIAGAKEVGKLPAEAGAFDIRQVDISSGQFGALDAALSKWTAFIQQQFPDYKFNYKDTGIISTDNQTKILHTDNLVMQLALQELIDVSKKQLEGIYNLPTDSSFYVPFQGYKLGFGGGGGGGAFGGAAGKGAEEETKIPEATTMLERTGKTWDQNKTAQMMKLIEKLELPQIKPALPQEDKRTGMTVMELEKPTVLENLINAYTTTIDAITEGLSTIPELFSRFFGLGQPPKQDQLEPGAVPPDTSLKSLFDAQKSGLKVSTALTLNLNSTSTLVVDGRALATIVKQYLYEDLIRMEGVAGSSTRTIAI